MEIYFTYELKKELRDSLIEFYNEKKDAYIYQHPDWLKIINPQKKICYFIGYNEKKIIVYAVITEKFRLASIFFGPVSNNKDVIIDSIYHINKYYRKNNFGLLTIQLAEPSGENTEYIQSNLLKKVDYYQKAGKYNWSTLILDLKKDFDELKKDFSVNHKRNIARALKIGLYIRKMDDYQSMTDLSILYNRMYKKRKIVKPFSNSKIVFKNIFEFLQNNNLGFILGTYDQNNNLIGGIILIYQGDSMLYFYGTSDINIKHIPVLHLTFFEAIKYAKEMGFKYFDFGGYNHYVNEKDPLFQINRFKKGFGGKYVFYPKIMYYNLNMLPFCLIKILRPVYLKFKLLMG